MLKLNPTKATLVATSIGLAFAVAAPSVANANCHQRKATGAVAGTVGGALIGNAISHGAGGTLLGAGLGALAGHTIAGATCHDEYRHAYYRRHYHRRYDDERRYGYSGRPEPQYAAAGAPAGQCVTEQQPYYDAYGRLVYRPTQICR